MQKSKVLRLLRILTKEEIKRLYKFLQSPFYNANPAIVKLYLLLRKEYPNFESSKLEKEGVFRRVFSKKEYDHQKFLNLLSDFTQLLLKYLQIIQIEKEPYSQDQLTLRAFAQRPHAYDFLEKHRKKVNQMFDKKSHRNADFYQQKYQLNKLFFNHPQTDKFQLSKFEYDESMKDLDRWFLLEKLLMSCEMKTRENPLSEQYDIWLLDEIRQGIHRYPKESPIGGTYLHMLDLLDHSDTVSYAELKTLFFQHFKQFTYPQQQNILQSLINHAIREGNKGHTHFVKENLSLYKFGLEKELFFEYGILNDMIYISIVNVALRAKEPIWCQAFIEKYQSYLPPSAHKDAQTLASALWLYNNGQHKETINLLRHVEFLNVYYQVQARVLLIKIFFEAHKKGEDNLKLLLAQIDSFDKYLRRNKIISDSQRVGLLHFTQSVKKLSMLLTTNSHSVEEIRKMKEILENLSPLYNQKWLLDQLS